MNQTKRRSFAVGLACGCVAGALIVLVAVGTSLDISSQVTLTSRQIVKMVISQAAILLGATLVGLAMVKGVK